METPDGLCTEYPPSARCDACRGDALAGEAIQCNGCCGGLFCSDQCVADFHAHGAEYAVGAQRALAKIVDAKIQLEVLSIPVLKAHLAQLVAIVEGKLMRPDELAAVDSAHMALGHRWNGRTWVRHDGQPLEDEDIRF